MFRHYSLQRNAHLNMRVSVRQLTHPDPCCCCTGPSNHLMSSLAFFGFCHTCKLVDEKVNISDIDRIWHRVNIMVLHMRCEFP